MKYNAYYKDREEQKYTQHHYWDVEANNTLSAFEELRKSKLVQSRDAHELVFVGPRERLFKNKTGINYIIKLEPQV